VLAATVIVINVAIYGWLLLRRSHRSRVSVDGEGKHAA
jgi:hypothetical protein